MQSFKEFITEGRDAPLYHATSVSRAINILGSNILRLSNEFIFRKGDKASISFTRDIKVAWKHGVIFGKRDDVVIFEVDQAKLAQNYKLEPFQFWSQPSRNNGSRINKARLERKDYTEEAYNEFEERIIGSDVKNFDRYIKKVIIYSPNTYALLTHMTSTGIISEHPLLYIYTTKTFPNK